VNERQKQLYLLFKTAIDAERSAQEMYSRLAAVADDDRLRNVIEQFGREESRHEQFLVDEYADMRAEFAV
jgi:rubrerythrin